MHNANGQTPPSPSPHAPALDNPVAFDEEKMCKRWSDLRSHFPLLRDWDAPRGIILVGSTPLALEAAVALAGHLGGFPVVLNGEPIPKADWDREVARYLDGRVSPDALREQVKERLCIIVPRLDHQPEWLQAALVAPMDGSRPPPPVGYCVLATAVLALSIPKPVLAHFVRVKQMGGGPPLFRADQLPMPPPEMRLPPEAEEEPTLFSIADAE